MVLPEMVAMEFTKKTHEVAPHIDRAKTCENCQSFEHNTYQCKNPSQCGKCPSVEQRDGMPTQSSN